MAEGTIPQLVDASAESFGPAEALVAGTRRWSFTRLREEIRRAGRAAVALGVAPGERVAIWAPNSPEWIVAALGAVSAGAVLVPLNTRFKGPEAADIIRRSGATALVTVRGFLGVDYPRMLAGERTPDLRETVLLSGPADDSALGYTDYLEAGEGVPDSALDERARAIGAEDPCDLIYTSGTTGRPKGVVTTHGQTLRVYREWSGIATLAAGDRYLLVNPFFHTFGYKAGILACLLRGVTMIPEAAYDAGSALRRISEERVSVLLAPPTIFGDLLDHPERSRHDLSALRLAGTGAASIPVDLIRRVREELRVPSVFTAYGLSESSGVVSVCPPRADARTVAHTTGPALPGTEVRIADPGDAASLSPGARGEIQVRGYNVMRGYHRDLAATKAAFTPDGWLRTGDVGTLDERGYLTVTDRLKDMYVVGGFNAYPAEIEEVLAEHEAVAEAAVVGVPDARLGEVGAAFVVPRGPLDTDALIGWMRRRVANYKVPREVTVVDALPRNASGKVLKTRLRAGDAPADLDE